MEGLQLSAEEQQQLAKAFKDEEFCKAFAEYAKGMQNPEYKQVVQMISLAHSLTWE